MTTDLDEHLKNISEADENRLSELLTTLESPGFAPDEMVECRKCGRTNPPNRLTCLYCAEEMSLDLQVSEFVKLSLRRLESWEKGFNLILVRPCGTSIEAIERTLVNDLTLHREVLQKVTSASAPVPLARVENEREATVLCSRFEKLGIDCAVISDEKLGSDRHPRRLRRLEFGSDQFTSVDFNTGERLSIAADDLVLIVTGKLVELRTESLEKKKKRNSTIIDQTETASDESVVDLYARGDTYGFRVCASGFDFSGLGSEKSLLAADNMPKLIRKLTEISARAKLVDEYAKVQRGLDAVWDLELRKNTEGLRRSGFGKMDFGNVSTVNNLSQFTRYSRLQRQFI